jgi:hypothetical protein
MAQAYIELAERHPSAASSWYAGWALVNAAEWRRRGEEPGMALIFYNEAALRFWAAQREPAFVDTSDHYLAMCALGSGFAHLLLDERAEAAGEFYQAIGIRPGLDGLRDGLDREPLDLIDGALEWRANGACPVDAVAMAERLIAADPANALWAGAIADALLRESLRWFGRSEDLEPGLAGLRDSVSVARRALAADDSEPNRRALAQSATTLAEILLDRGLETAEPWPLLAEAAAVLGLVPPAPDAALEALADKAAELRSALGPARPVPRPGR